MRYDQTVNAEGRVLAVFRGTQWKLLSVILTEVKMDTAFCLRTLKLLVAQGVLQRGRVKRPGRGKLPHAYRRRLEDTMDRTETSATCMPHSSPYRYSVGLTQEDVERLVRGEVPPAVQDTLISLMVSMAETPAEAVTSAARRRQR